RILRVDGSRTLWHDEERTRRSSRSRIRSCASCGSCSHKASSTTCTKLSERNRPANLSPLGKRGTYRPACQPSLAIDDEQRGHRTCLELDLDMCPDRTRSSTRGC